MTTKESSKVRRALGLSLLNTVVGRLGTFLTGIVLARLLAPEDFGVYAVALVALTAMLSLNELGVSIAIVRWPGDPKRIAPTVTTISVLSSVLLYAACFVTAPVFSAAMGAPEATGVVRLLCATVVVDGITAAAVQLANREFKQGSRLVVDSLNLVLTTAVTVGMAVAGNGAWSLAVGQLTGNVLSGVMLCYLVRMWPRFGFDRSLARELLVFGLPLAGGSLLVFAMLNIHYIVTGRMLGAIALGFFLQAFNLSSWPVNMFSMVVRRVSLPAFAALQDDREAREATFARFTSLLAVFTLPVCVLLGLLALPLVSTLYGHKWAASAAALQWLAVLALVRVACELAYDYLVALGRSRTTMWLQGGWLAALAVALPVGAHFGGIEGVAVAHAAVALLVALPAFAVAVGRTGVHLASLVRPLVRPVLGSAAMVAVLLLLRLAFAPSALLLVVGGLACALVYAPFVWPLRAELRHLG
ncbi:polysaccharide transporter, PST family [Amycolatopsis xylanica]|uniref:Polysaccharide transporter, PST family n=1 Tax=Amycolatopsis xylanica TaxID=589385 RepID=A0A1H3L8T4_9PSEU|nr:lipopolysaccharide biosynthesis protein [Amycolatopsis xylanica]SDY60927.1 polysaccharide transporter, PST family [Amycolatopsis xylanica]